MSFTGRRHSEESKLKMSMAKKGISVNKGEKNPQWKGDNVGKKTGLHRYIERNKPKPVNGMCEICGIEPWYDVANITGVYNRDFKNWQFQCRRCHMRSDGRMKNLNPNTKGTKLPEWIRMKMRESHKGQRSPMLGKHHSDEAKSKIANANKCKIPWNSGKTGISEEYKRNLSESMKKRWRNGVFDHRHRRGQRYE